jgi:hypothetical protein
VATDHPLSIHPKGFSEVILAFPLRGIGAPYHLTLPDAASGMTALELPIRARCALVVDKQVDSVSFEAQVRRLSLKGAEIHTKQTLEPLNNLRLQVLDGTGREIGSHVYAKVTETVPDHPAAFMIRFTGGMQQEVEGFFRDAMQAPERV